MFGLHTGLYTLAYGHFRICSRIPNDLTSEVVYMFKCGLVNGSYCGEYVRHLNVGIGKHVCISPLTKKQKNPKNNRSVANHLLFCNHSACYDNFSILTRGSNKFLLELKESL